jgi:hypothetical protein
MVVLSVVSCLKAVSLDKSDIGVNIDYFMFVEESIIAGKVKVLNLVLDKLVSGDIGEGED